MIGSTISHYKILEKLGEGGMGVVYLAEDTNLDRRVALKFLPAHLSASEQDKARFIQEAKAAATLNHPNICTVHAIEEYDAPASTGAPAGKQLFIVMEHVDGHTLRERKQNISIKQALDIGIQIADGLAVAHEKGIVHRDIKPENIMVRKDGIVQLMDFGLAKLRGASRLTKEGSTIGTVGYMSPEQVEGADTDHRTDIFSMGVIMYELLTGQSPFKGVHETAIMYEIVNVDPAPMSSIRPEIDPELDAIILECLAKEPAERYQWVGEVGKDLRRFKRESSRQHISRVSRVRESYRPPTESMGEAKHDSTGMGHSSVQQISTSSSTQLQASPAATHKNEWLAWSISGVLLAVSMTLTVLYLRVPSLEIQSISSNILPPENITFATQSGGAGEGLMELSADGKMLAFVGADSAGKTRLAVRALNGLSSRVLPGTDGASYPFWSPDNRYVGFFQGGKLKKIEASGGPPMTICDASDARGGSWNQNGEIIFSPAATDPISLVQASGGTPVPITTLDTLRHERTHRWPYFLPDGKRFLYFSRSSFGGVEREEDALILASLDGKESKRLMSAKGNVAFASGYLLFLREKTLMAQPFDAANRELTGEARPIAEPVEYDLGFNRAVYSVSQNGILIYQSSAAQAGVQLRWFDRSGKALGKVGETADYGYVGLSPDEQRLSFDTYDASSRNRDIWIYDLTRSLKTRFTFDPSVDENPVWSPDGSRIVFHSDRKGHYDLYVKTTSGAGVEEALYESPIPKTPLDWSSDGRFIVFAVVEQKTKSDIWILPLDGERKPFPFLQSDFDEFIASISKDLHWIAYLSNESGSLELYVRPFIGKDGSVAVNQSRKWQVSTSGVGNYSAVRWSRDGTKLYYLSIDNKMMVADVRAEGETFEIGSVTSLFEVSSQSLNGFAELTADGQRFLTFSTVGGLSSPPLTLVTNWMEQLRKK